MVKNALLSVIVTGWIVASPVFGEDQKESQASRFPNPVRTVWEPESAEVARVLQHSDHEFFGVAFVPNGELMVTSTKDGVIDVWKTSDWTVLRTISTGGQYFQPACAPDGQRVAVAAAGNAVQILSLVEGSIACTLRGHIGGVLRLAWSPNGKLLATGGWDQVVRVWDVERQQLQQTIQSDEKTIFALAFSPDSKTLAIRTQGETVLLWDLEHKRERLRLSKQCNNSKTVAFSPDGQLWASMSDRESVTVRDLDGGQERWKLAAQWSQVAWAPRRDLLAVTSHARLQLHDAKSGKLTHQFRCHTDWIESLAFSPDAHTLATVSGHGKLVLWDVSSIAKLQKTTVPEISSEATVNGRYSDVLQILEAPQDADVFGRTYEFGYRIKPEPGTTGYWVYSAPRWYVFETSRIGLHFPPRTLPDPIKLASGQRRIWLAFPNAICGRAFCDAVAVLSTKVPQFRDASVTGNHQFQFIDEQRNAGPILILTIDLNEATTSEEALVLLLGQNYGLTSAAVLSQAEAQAAGLLPASKPQLGPNTNR